MSEHIRYPEEVLEDTIESAYQRFCEIRRRDISFKELLVEYIAATGKHLDQITAADLVRFSNNRIDSPFAATLIRLEEVLAALAAGAAADKTDGI